MKRTFRIVAGAMVLSLAILAMTRLSAQGQGTAQAPQTRVALINMTRVVNEYAKWKAFKEQIKDVAKKYDDQFQVMKKNLELEAARAQNAALAQPERDQAEKNIKRIRNEITELNDDAKKVVGEQQATQLKVIYQEVAGLAERTAKVRGYDMVLQYNDPFTTETDKTGQLSLQRKLTTDGFLPLYVTPGMDITAEVIDSLNTWYKQSSAPKAPGG